MDGSLTLKKIKWFRLEAQVYTLLKSHKVTHQRVIVAVSGGLDSMVLLHLLYRIQSTLKLDLTVAHVHHGTSKNKKWMAFRNKALRFVEKKAAHYGLDFEVFRGETEGTSEADLRDLRHKGLHSLALKKGALVAYAHHQDDLLETRVIRLIRGVGSEGLSSMSVLNENRLRPLLAFSRAELQKYAVQNKLKWVDDPSNSSREPLRNWIRHEWLPLLEKKRQGAKSTLARSLENLSQTTSSREWVREFVNQRGVKRAALLSLNKHEKRQVIASYLRGRVHKNYSLAHIEELLKRIESPEKELSFRLINCDWKVNAEYIEII